ncbi:LOB domain-containing protein 40 [Striga hermonthica]|uniref:LOB domain-containing protein 40 n=1 Tax=Striga hermonthica TaxID=68872 RepID=A0A9N7RM27_STRHE|nr:LOB domain-containing protein 40 [Striga hermonthica]
MSCNGCRVLRKGCSNDCTLRPSLQWIKSAESQANAAIFLAKFYGRAGLLNLIDAGPSHLRSEVFRSLLYDACGRIINPVYGYAGLIRAGGWQRCQDAVDAVLRGRPIEGAAAPCGIRHVSTGSGARRRGKGPAKGAVRLAEEEEEEEEPRFTITGWSGDREYGVLDFAPRAVERAASHDSFSVETVEPSLVVGRVGRTDRGVGLAAQPEEIGLELTLGRESGRFV